MSGRALQEIADAELRDRGLVESRLLGWVEPWVLRELGIDADSTGLPTDTHYTPEGGKRKRLSAKALEYLGKARS